MLYEALAGRPPFDRETELAVVFAHLHEPTPRITDVQPELPAGMDHVLRKATAKDPKERYPSCGALVEPARGALAGDRARRARPGRLAIGCAVAAAAAAIAVVVISSGDDAAPVHRLAVGGTGLALIDARTRTVDARVALPEQPSDVVFDRRSAWALLPAQQRVSELRV